MHNNRKWQPWQGKQKGKVLVIETQKHKEGAAEVVLGPLKNQHCMAGAGSLSLESRRAAQTSNEGQAAGLLSDRAWQRVCLWELREKALLRNQLPLENIRKLF